MNSRKATFDFHAAISPVLTGLLVTVALLLVSRYNYLLFHALAEGFSIIVAGATFALVWNTWELTDQGYLQFLGIAFFTIAGLDFFHTLAYKGMGVFEGYSANLPTQLWIATRYVQSLSLLIAPTFLQKKVNRTTSMGFFALLTTILLALIFTGIFPDCYIEDQGLTHFKIISEYVISLLLGGAILRLYRHRSAFSPTIFRWLVVGLAFSIVSELAFTFYVSVYGLSNLIGHLFKIFAFYAIYRAIVETGLREPYALLFHDLQQRNEQLAQEIVERKRAERRLARYTSHLKRSNKELEQFGYVISHDLQEPVRMVKGYLSLLQQRYQGELDEKADMFIHYAVDGADRMQEMIDALLDLSRVETRGKALAPIDAEVVWNRTLEVLRATIERTEAEITHDPLPTVMADQAQLGQVFQNLLTNALKFHREDVPPRIHLSAGQADGAWVFSVRDNGIGIDPAQTDRIFRIFQRLHTPEKYQGTGIGLALCKRIVERHGGRIWVESEPGAGSTFFFTLPQRASSPAA